MLPDISPQNYQQQLDKKLSSLNSKLASAGLIIDDIDVFDSPIRHFRMRTEFRVWHEGEKSSYAMHHPETKEIFTLTDFPIASKAICKRMPILIQAINTDESLSKKIFQAEFLSTSTDETLISLIYHRSLDDRWIERAKELERELDAHIIGRSRKQKVTISQDYVIETMAVDRTDYHYQQVENSFTQPNAHICQKMLEWTNEKTKKLNGDLLELYCGNGNFTLPLSKNFDKVLATEVSKTSVKSALYNIQKNQTNNIKIARLSSEETTQALNNERQFRRLSDIELDTYQFTTVLVDPPRAGLDQQTLALINRFDNIIYISCNPDTFIENAKDLTTHKLDSLAIFDQFPYTNHLELGAVFSRTNKSKQ